MKELKKLIKRKQYNEIVEYVGSVISQHSLSEIIAFLKKEEVFIDRNGKRCYDQYTYILRDKCPLFIEYCDELELVNQLFAQERKLQRVLKGVPKNKRLSNIVYCLNTNYLLSLKKLKSLKPQKDGIQDTGITLDGTALLYNVTFKSILYDDEIWQDGAFCYNAFDYKFDFCEYKKCHKYMQLSSITNAWDTVYKDWKQGFVKIFRQGDMVATEYLKDTQLEWLKLSKAKLQIYDYIKELEISNVASKDPRCFSDELKDFDELIAWGTIKAYLHINDLDTIIDDVPIRFWIKAYCALTRYSKKVNFINSIYSINFVRTFLSNRFLLKTSKKWITLFTDNGIPIEYAAKIFECLKYNKKSSDLYDFPFVKVKKKYMIIPALLQIAHPGELLKSRFRQNDFNISEKGKSFEKELLELVSKQNIPALQIRRKDSQQEYECDLAFVLGDTLFLCECKDNGDKYVFNYISEFYRNDLQQAKRIFDFYDKHIDEIKVEFSNQNIKIGNIKRIEKLIIYNTVFHSIIEENGVKIVDAERFVSYFRRGNLDKRICQLYKGPIDCLLGKITYAKFIKYLKSNYTICGYDKIIRLDYEEFEFGDLDINIQFECCNNIDREEIMNITNPFFAEAKAFFEDYKNRGIL